MKQTSLATTCGLTMFLKFENIVSKWLSTTKDRLKWLEKEKS